MQKGSSHTYPGIAMKRNQGGRLERVGGKKKGRMKWTVASRKAKKPTKRKSLPFLGY